MNYSNTKFSVLISIYEKDNSEYLDAAIESIIEQTYPPDEVVLVEDGQLTKELLQVVQGWQQKRPGIFKVVSLPENGGLGVALREGLKACSYGIVARMDADDISCPERFEKQFKFLQDNPDVAVVSSWMLCFENVPDEIIFIRKMPKKYEDIKKIIKYRNPVLHPPVMFRRSEVEAAGGYSDLRRNQDYHLWIRMILKGSKITCIPQPLYKFRCDQNFLARRTSMKHTISIIKLQKEFKRMGFITYPQYFLNVSIRILICFLPITVIRFVRIKCLKL
ncbi:MAG: glycosyltransferase [Planctomycetes bacterium]|nr:glycosyltransferase [Planctomycetota bacterium]